MRSIVRVQSISPRPQVKNFSRDTVPLSPLNGKCEKTMRLPVVEESISEEEGSHHNGQIQELTEDKSVEVDIVPIQATGDNNTVCRNY